MKQVKRVLSIKCDFWSRSQLSQAACRRIQIAVMDALAVERLVDPHVLEFWDMPAVDAPSAEGEGR